MDKVKILFFIAGMAPTEEELVESRKIGICTFRNASNYDAVTSAETCDFVAGLVPALYADFPKKGFAKVAEKKEVKTEEKKATLAWTPNA